MHGSKRRSSAEHLRRDECWNESSPRQALAKARLELPDNHAIPNSNIFLDATFNQYIGFADDTPGENNALAAAGKVHHRVATMAQIYAAAEQQVRVEQVELKREVDEVF